MNMRCSISNAILLPFMKSDMIDVPLLYMKPRYAHTSKIKAHDHAITYFED